MLPIKEKFYVRDLGYSLWHRTLPHNMTCTDIDFVEYCPDCFEPLAIIEVGYGLDNTDKVNRHNISAIKALASKARVPFYVVLFEGENHGHTKCPYCKRPFPRSKVIALRKKLLYPRESYWVDMSPEEYAEWLKELRRQHSHRR